jgi:hypothetical protein
MSGGTFMPHTVMPLAMDRYTLTTLLLLLFLLLFLPLLLSFYHILHNRQL